MYSKFHQVHLIAAFICYSFMSHGSLIEMWSVVIYFETVEQRAVRNWGGGGVSYLDQVVVTC